MSRMSPIFTSGYDRSTVQRSYPCKTFSVSMSPRSAAMRSHITAKDASVVPLRPCAYVAATKHCAGGRPYPLTLESFAARSAQSRLSTEVPTPESAAPANGGDATKRPTRKRQLQPKRHHQRNPFDQFSGTLPWITGSISGAFRRCCISERGFHHGKLSRH